MFLEAVGGDGKKPEAFAVIKVRNVVGYAN
jgi:hypothetical protein